jgi:hypothetical protein
MTNGQVFKHYVWIVNTLRHGGRLTLNDLNERWVNDEVADGNPLPRMHSRVGSAVHSPWNNPPASIP